MTLRLKFVIALVALSALATIAIGVSTYSSTANRLGGEVDRSLANAVDQVFDRLGRGPGPDVDGDANPASNDGRGFPGPRRPLSFEQILIQAIDEAGTVWLAPASGALPVDAADIVVAADAEPRIERWSRTEIDGTSYRMVTVSLGQSAGALQAARSLAENDRVLAAQRNRTILAMIVVTIAAAAIGWLIARQATRRLVRLTAAAEEVANTGRLDVAVAVGGTDEAGRLGVAFGDMLGALARSRDDQQRLVQDAGHELRTPLTSLRTNISVLRRFDDLPAETRHRVLDDLDGEARELTTLVNELVQLATEERTEEIPQIVELAPIVERVADRARRRSGRLVLVDADACRALVRPQALERAVGNLVENALKFDDRPDGTIDIEVRNGRIAVSDRGPGIEPADLPRVFDRFYRSISARSRPGSGLGLSIVDDVAKMHGGTAFATNRTDGGATVGLALPIVT
jgi:two-component system, OmpR family, sensor histidine kinase MprB